MTEFTHLRLLDPAWKPGPGERYADAPKARMRVTRMTATTVYYTYADGSGGKASMTRKTWNRDYAPTPERTTMTNTKLPELTAEQYDAGLRAWAKGDLATQAVAEIIIGTHLRDDVVPLYLDWNDDYTMARPDLRKLITDDNAGKVYLSTTAHLLAAFALNLWRGPSGSAYEVDLRELWKLGTANRQAVISALAQGLKVTSL